MASQKEKINQDSPNMFKDFKLSLPDKELSEINKKGLPIISADCSNMFKNIKINLPANNSNISK